MIHVCYEKNGSDSGSSNQKLTLFGSERRITQSKLNEITDKCDAVLLSIIRPVTQVSNFHVTSEVKLSFDIVEWIFSIEIEDTNTPFAYLSARNSGLAVNIEKLRVASALQRKGIGTAILKHFRQIVELTGFSTMTTDIADPGNPMGVKKVRIDKILGMDSQGSGAASASRMTAFFTKQGFEKYPVFIQKSGMILNLQKKSS